MGRSGKPGKFKTRDRAILPELRPFAAPFAFSGGNPDATHGAIWANRAGSDDGAALRLAKTNGLPLN